MPKPQQPELRRSGFVAALDPDATESDLEAHERPSTKGGGGPVPDEQRPGHHPEHDQDKPDLDKFAERLGIVAEGEEPEDAPRVEDDDASTVTRLEDAPSKVKARATDAEAEPEPAASQPKQKPASQPKQKAAPPRIERSFSPIGVLMMGPLTAVTAARTVLRLLKRLRP